MLQLRREQYLAAESIGVQTGGEVGRQNLYDDLPVQLQLTGEENARHTGATHLPLDAVAGTEYFLKLREEI